jgi:hypothetical protein
MESASVDSELRDSGLRGSGSGSMGSALVDSDMGGSSFRGLDLRGSDLWGSGLRGPSLRGSNLLGVLSLSKPKHIVVLGGGLGKTTGFFPWGGGSGAAVVGVDALRCAVDLTPAVVEAKRFVSSSSGNRACVLRGGEVVWSA